MRVLLWCLLGAVPVAAQQPDLHWRASHTTWAIASTAMIAADCASTYDLVVRRGGHEVNPFLGAHPTSGHLLTVCSLGAATNLLVAWAVPAKTRIWWLRAVTVVELGVVLNNVLRR